MFPADVNVGKEARATTDNKETNTILSIRIFLLIKFEILFFILKRVTTSNAWATISNIMKAIRINLLKNLYKSYSKRIPKKIECTIKNIAELTPKNKKR